MWPRACVPCGSSCRAVQILLYLEEGSSSSSSHAFLKGQCRQMARTALEVTGSSCSGEQPLLLRGRRSSSEERRRRRRRRHRKILSFRTTKICSDHAPPYLPVVLIFGGPPSLGRKEEGRKKQLRRRSRRSAAENVIQNFEKCCSDDAPSLPAGSHLRACVLVQVGAPRVRASPRGAPGVLFRVLVARARTLLLFFEEQRDFFRA